LQSRGGAVESTLRVQRGAEGTERGQDQRVKVVARNFSGY